MSTSGVEPPDTGPPFSRVPGDFDLRAKPPRRGPAWWQDIQVIGGLTAVFLGLVVVLFVAVLSMSLIHTNADKVATIATSAFTVIGTLVGAYFGVKVGTDGTKTAMEQTQRAVELMREEAAKAQAFAAWVAPESAEQAVSDAQALSRPGGLESSAGP